MSTLDVERQLRDLLGDTRATTGAPGEKRDSFTGAGGCRMSAIDLAKTCHKIPAVLSYRTVCGKPNCRCVEGSLHGPYVYLRWRDGAVNRRRYVPAHQAAEVRAIVDGRRAERDRRRLLFSLASELLAQLDADLAWFNEVTASEGALDE